MFLLLVDNSSPSTLLLIVLLFSSFHLWLTSPPSIYILAIVFLSRKGVMDQYINLLYLILFPLASSTHHLHSNLVSTLGLPVWLKPNKLLVTRSPSQKTLLGLVAQLRSHRPLVFMSLPHSLDRTSTCSHTTLECALLERSLITQPA